MKSAQFKALLSEQAFQTKQTFPEIQLNAAKAYGLEPLYKRWANCGGSDGFISEYYKDANDDVVYAIDICEAVVFFKLEITAANTAKITQVGYDKQHNKNAESNVVICEFAEHEWHKGWHIGFTGFSALLDALEIEAKGLERDDVIQAIKAFYKKGDVAEFEENESRYCKKSLTLFGDGDGESIKVSKDRDGKLFGLINLQ